MAGCDLRAGVSVSDHILFSDGEKVVQLEWEKHAPGDAVIDGGYRRSGRDSRTPITIRG